MNTEFVILVAIISAIVIGGGIAAAKSAAMGDTIRRMFK